MASKQRLKLFDLKNKLISSYIGLAHFVRYSILMRKKETVIIGNASDPIVCLLVDKLSPQHKITIIEEASEQTNTSPTNNICHLLIQQDNYPQIQKQLEGANINSIIVSPCLFNSSKFSDFQDQNFADQTAILHHRLLMRNLLAYRLAHKYLYTTGLVILPCSQRQFINYKLSQRNQTEAELLHDSFCKQVSTSFLEGLVSTQVAYLGVVMGDRQFTPMQSKSIVALVSQLWQESEHRSMIVQRYAGWAKGTGLPAPGCFALFKPATPKTKHHYVEYL